MTLEMWNFIGITSIVLFVLLVVIMIIRKDLKDRLFHKMHKDEPTALPQTSVPLP